MTSSDNLRSLPVQLKFTKEEKEQLERLARSNSKTVAGYIRQALYSYIAEKEPHITIYINGNALSISTATASSLQEQLTNTLYPTKKYTKHQHQRSPK